MGLSSIEFESQDISVLFSSPSSGVLLHEVFGHLLEADFFLSSPLKKYLNERIGPKELTIVDDGTMGYIIFQNLMMKELAYKRQLLCLRVL